MDCICSGWGCLRALRAARDGVGQQRGGLRCGAFTTELHEFGKSIVIGESERSRVDGYNGIGQSQRTALVLQDRNVESAGEHAGKTFELLAAAERHGEVDGNDSVGVHLAHSLDGNVFDHASIGEDTAVDLYGSEDTRNRHAGAH